MSAVCKEKSVCFFFPNKTTSQFSYTPHTQDSSLSLLSLLSLSLQSAPPPPIAPPPPPPP
ncbi:hypothetical protein HanLR1_Chr15g0569611 [Helianthus annuus]|nr:hypothetical protein HanLR1_Chr15g0569611 [Helianthus annuus]